MIAAIIFDLDGVLVDATEWHYSALNKALGVFGFSIDREEHESFYNGLPTHVKLEHLTKEKGFPKTLHKLVHELKQKYTWEIIEASCTEDFVKVDMVRKLRAEGYRLAVCSNAMRQTVQLMLEKSGLRSFFELVLSNEDVACTKPDPDMFLRAFEKLGLRPSECLILEDSDPGKEAARASGGITLEIAQYDEVNYALVRNFLQRDQV